jgi:predicted thioesterase
MSEKTERKIAVTMAALESHNHITGDIERGLRSYNRGGVKFDEREPGVYLAHVPHKGGAKAVNVTFTRDGLDIEQHYCDCGCYSSGDPVCRHVVAAVLAIQGGVVESKLTLGKAAAVSAAVSESNTAKAVGSGSLDVFATPMMIALMERAACKCLEDCLKPEQTSVGTLIEVSHTAASPIGAEITATATIEYVFGRRIEFAVTASDGAGEIGRGKHHRVIVDAKLFESKVNKRA